MAFTSSFENSGHADFAASSVYPNFSHISSATCGANGDNIATLAELILCNIPETLSLLLASTLFAYQLKSDSNENSMS